MITSSREISLGFISAVAISVTIPISVLIFFVSVPNMRLIIYLILAIISVAFQFYVLYDRKRLAEHDGLFWMAASILLFVGTVIFAFR